MKEFIAIANFHPVENLEDITGKDKAILLRELHKGLRMM